MALVHRLAVSFIAPLSALVTTRALNGAIVAPSISVLFISGVLSRALVGPVQQISPCLGTLFFLELWWLFWSLLRCRFFMYYYTGLFRDRVARLGFK